MTHYVNLIQMCVRCKIELISILYINCCVRSVFAYGEPSFTLGHLMVGTGNFGQKLQATISDTPYKYMY